MICSGIDKIETPEQLRFFFFFSFFLAYLLTFSTKFLFAKTN